MLIPSGAILPRKHDASHGYEPRQASLRATKAKLRANQVVQDKYGRQNAPIGLACPPESLKTVEIDQSNSSKTLQGQVKSHG